MAIASEDVPLLLGPQERPRLDDDQDRNVNALDRYRTPGVSYRGPGVFGGKRARCGLHLVAKGQDARHKLTLLLRGGLLPLKLAARGEDEILNVIEQHVVKDQLALNQGRGRSKLRGEPVDQLLECGEAASMSSPMVSS